MRLLWIGLGKFGLPIASHCQQSGHQVLAVVGAHGTVGAREIERSGGQIVSNTSAVDCDALVTCLPTPADVRNALSEIGTPLPRVVIDLTTGDPDSARRHADTLSEQRVRYFDCPASGSLEHARSGKLTVFAGATEGTQRELDIFLGTIADHISWLGAVGHGQSAKLVNQIIHIATLTAVVEGLRFGMAQGVNMEQLMSALYRSSSDSVMLRRLGPSILANDFTTRFRMRLALKDIQFALKLGDQAGLDLPVARIVEELLQAACDGGLGDHDFSAIAKWPLADRAASLP